MSRKHSSDDVSTKIGGWDGRFVVEKPVVPKGCSVVGRTRGTLAHDQWTEPENHHNEQICNNANQPQQQHQLGSPQHQQYQHQPLQQQPQQLEQQQQYQHQPLQQQPQQLEQKQQYLLKQQEHQQQHHQQRQQLQKQEEHRYEKQQQQQHQHEERQYQHHQHHHQQQQQQQQHQQHQVQQTQHISTTKTNVPVTNTGSKEFYVRIERDDRDYSDSVKPNTRCVKENQTTSTNVNVNGDRVLDHQQYHNRERNIPINTSNGSNLNPYGTSNYIPYGSMSAVNQKTTQQTSGNNYHGYTAEPEILPPRWDGTFPPNYLQGRPKSDQNQSTTNNFYGFSTQPEILPMQWDGTFGKSGETYLQPDRNRSATNNFYGYNSEPTILPTTWNGQFQLDPNDVRIKSERNASDVRDYADHRNFQLRSK